MTETRITRRAALGASLGAIVAGPARAEGPYSLSDDDFTYKVVRSDAEWMEMLGEEAYGILREGGTELSYTSALWDRYGPGEYFCKGCGLKVYDEEFRSEIDKGWVFFRHAVPDAVMLGVDRVQPAAYGGSGMEVPGKELMEVHCRRCASHLGHIVNIGGTVHCINGIALDFVEAAA